MLIPRSALAPNQMDLRPIDFLALACCIAPAILSGCGPSDVGPVSGKVTLDGRPLTGAVIVFENASRGISLNAPLAADGTFTLRTFDKAGLPPGEYQVAIRPGDFGSGETPLAVAPGASPPSSPVPMHYRSTATSGLTAKVQLGSNPPYEFPLVTKAK
jgi:hypothetical protein